MFGIGTKTFMFAAWNYSNQAHNNMIHISNIHYNHMVNANCPSPITKVQKERLYRKNKQNTIALNARKNFFLFALDSYACKQRNLREILATLIDVTIKVVKITF